jgi:hypothetical protein
MSRSASAAPPTAIPTGAAAAIAPVGPRADALTVLRAIYRDPAADLAKRLDAAKAALPYEHQRKAKDDGAASVTLSLTIELGPEAHGDAP